MGKLNIVLLVVLLLALLMLGSTQVFGSNGTNSTPPTVVVSPSVVPLDTNSQVVIMGSGYEPGKEIRLLAHLSGGKAAWATMSDIGGSLDPEPIMANEFGSWVTVWTVGRYSRLAGTGIYKLEVVDDEYNTLASAPFGFIDTKKPQEEWPVWSITLEEIVQ